MHSDEHYPVNLGNPQEITILEFAIRIKQLTGADVPIVFEPLPQDDPKQRRPDISKARQLLDWEPKVSLQDGLENTLRYFREQLLASQPAPGSK
jgi:dTDP-glucose 4,6-dehydratase